MNRSFVEKAAHKSQNVNKAMQFIFHNCNESLETDPRRIMIFAGITMNWLVVETIKYMRAWILTFGASASKYFWTGGMIGCSNDSRPLFPPRKSRWSPLLRLSPPSEGRCEYWQVSPRSHFPRMKEKQGFWLERVSGPRGKLEAIAFNRGGGIIAG